MRLSEGKTTLWKHLGAVVTLLRWRNHPRMIPGSSSGRTQGNFGSRCTSAAAASQQRASKMCPALKCVNSVSRVVAFHTIQCTGSYTCRSGGTFPPCPSSFQFLDPGMQQSRRGGIVGVCQSGSPGVMESGRGSVRRQSDGAVAKGRFALQIALP